MRSVLVLLIAISAFCSAALAQHTSVQVEQPELRQELLDRAREDQAIRKSLLEKGMNEPDQELLDLMREIDEENTARMKAILEEHGFPGVDLVGEDGANAAFLLVQHADPDFQKLALPEVKKAYERGDLKGQSYALLLDRVLVQDGKEQVYGTQIKPIHLWTDGPETYPIQDSSGVDARRADMGLPPLDDYMHIIHQMYNGSQPAGRP